ncbi:hypothetical protein [Yinghuangia seranimata]|uniref:hypothetical protein n=1 Tax=Yinghuangia seranimata TaxID=408067 RepID=UPI00248D2FF3|nr:hypothetical protein [Yinghuangia seranimata]MDI2131948.1 hypothetical protein [Yinghuangia seranimata]
MTVGLTALSGPADAAPGATPATASAATPAAASTAAPDSPFYRSQPWLPRFKATTTGTSTAPGVLFTAFQPSGTIETRPVMYDNTGEPVWIGRNQPDGVEAPQALQYLGENAIAFWSRNIWDITSDTTGSHRPLGGWEVHPRMTTDSTGEKLLLTDKWGTTTKIDGLYQPVVMTTAQEINGRTNTETFRWSSATAGDSTKPIPVKDTLRTRNGDDPFDYLDVASLNYDPDGRGFVITARGTSGIYHVDMASRTLTWSFGSKSATIAPPDGETGPTLPEDARIGADGKLYFVDRSGDHVRGVVATIDVANGKATYERKLQPSGTVDPAQPLAARHQVLPGGGSLLSYNGRVAEYNASGALVFTGNAPTAAKYETTRGGIPLSVADSNPYVGFDFADPTTTKAFVSWNGRQGVASWRIRSGPDDRHMTVLKTVARSGFETEIALPATSVQNAFVAEALDADGKVLGQATAEPGRAAIDARYADPATKQTLGSPTYSYETLRSGMVGHFASGDIIWSPRTGARLLLGAFRSWGSQGFGAEPPFGYPVADQAPSGDANVIQQKFEKDTVFWAPAWGPWSITQAIYIEYRAAGAELGSWGRPLANAQPPASTGALSMQEFENRTAYSWSVWAGAIRGDFLEKYRQLGSENGTLGYPQGSTVPSPRPGIPAYQSFQRGTLIYQSTESGAPMLMLWGRIEYKWESAGGVDGPGVPLFEERPTADGVGRFIQFTNGYIYWSPNTDAWYVENTMAAKWTEYGAEHGFLGYPMMDAIPSTDGVGRYIHFQRGSIFWSPSTGAHEIHGGIRDKWAEYGWERGPMGYPTTDELGSADGVGRYNHFQGDESVYWSPSTGTHVVNRGIRARWLAAGAETGLLGYPTTDELATAGGVGRYSVFQRGSVYWSPATGCQVIRGGMFSQWVALDAERGRLGYPTSEEYRTADGQQRQDFQHGYILWSPQTQRTTPYYY